MEEMRLSICWIGWCLVIFGGMAGFWAGYAVTSAEVQSVNVTATTCMFHQYRSGDHVTCYLGYNVPGSPNPRGMESLPDGFAHPSQSRCSCNLKLINGESIPCYAVSGKYCNGGTVDCDFVFLDKMDAQCLIFGCGGLTALLWFGIVFTFASVVLILCMLCHRTQSEDNTTTQPLQSTV